MVKKNDGEVRFFGEERRRRKLAMVVVDDYRRRKRERGIVGAIEGPVGVF